MFFKKLSALLVMVVGLTTLAAVPAVVSADAHVVGEPEVIASGLEGAQGSTIGPGGMLYVTEGQAGRVTKINPRTGERSTFVEGLPKAIVPVGGAVDIVFYGRTAYVLVTLVDFVGDGTSETGFNGIYRVDGPDSFTLIADLGQYSVNNPPEFEFEFDIFTGVQYAMKRYRGGFAVTDGHYNRVLNVRRSGDVSEIIGFGNNVPTGLEVAGPRIYMAAAGPVPHLPETGEVLTFGGNLDEAVQVASGARAVIDVEFARRNRMFALSHGEFASDAGPGDVAFPNTGALLQVNRDGTFTPVVEGLNQPTSLEFIGDNAYIVTLSGDVVRVRNGGNPRL